MKTAIKCKNEEFLAIPLSHVKVPGIPKLWAIAHLNGYKMQKDDFLAVQLKNVNRLRTPKLCAIAH